MTPPDAASLAHRLHDEAASRARSRRVAGFLAGCLLFAFGEVRALDASRFISQYAHTAWRLQDGELPAPVYPFAQTSDGYLWIGTQAGVLRFDGARFVPLDTLSSKPLSSGFIVSLLGARDGSLWIGTNDGVSHWHDGELTLVADARPGAGALTEDALGHIWFVKSSDDGKSLCEIAGASVVCHGKEDGLDAPPGCCDSKMVLADDGAFWMNMDTGVVRWRAGAPSQTFAHEAKAKSGTPGFLVLATEPSGALWIGAPVAGPGLGLRRLVDGAWQSFSANGVDGSTLATQAILRDRENTLWVGTIDNGIYRILADRVDHFDSRDGLSSDCIYAFFEDAAGTLWVSTSAGIDRFRDVRVATFTKREGLSVDEVDSVLAARDGSIWVGTASGLDVFEQGRFRPIHAAQGLPGNQVMSLLQDDAGRIWAGVDKALAVHDGNRFEVIPARDGQPLGAVVALAQDTAGNVWASLGTQTRKLVRIRDGVLAEEFADPAVPPVSSLAADPHGGLWLGLRSGDIAHFDHGELETHAFNVGGAAVTRLIAASDGGVYGATARGFLALKGGKTRAATSETGLPCDAVHGLVEEPGRAIWLYMGCGLVRVGLGDIDRWLQEPGRPIDVETLDALDGVRPGKAPFDRAVRAPDGTLWFANGVSLQTFDPKSTPSAVPLQVHIEQVIADRDAHAPKRRIALPALTRDLEIAYTAPELAIPQRVGFRYRLDGHDDDWIEAGTRRQAFYTDLAPGDYRFEVAARRGRGAWSETPATIELTVLPAFYQTRWFIAFLAVAVAVASWLLFRWRLAHARAGMRARLDERLRERERIARELHDTFLQGVQGLMLHFQTAMERIPSSLPARELMEKALDHADNVIIEGRDRVTALRTLRPSAGDLPDALAALGDAFAEGGTCAFRLIEEGTRRELNPLVGDEVQRIACEALANAFRHARASAIDVTVAWARDRLAVVVADDGCGFDVAAREQQRPDGHWGLTGMRERAARMRAQVELESEAGVGTKVTVSVPSSLAYARTARRWFRWPKASRTP
ncbi:MAG: two-component regulator propeller domain-containing protein [Rhodanobacteraceae bacterium]